jgi:hypothetical protein
MDYYPSTGTVKTAMDHPTQGQTQMFCGDLDAVGLERVAQNERAHTGQGYQTTAQRNSNASRGQQTQYQQSYGQQQQWGYGQQQSSYGQSQGYQQQSNSYYSQSSYSQPSYGSNQASYGGRYYDDDEDDYDDDY